jgi:aquaporin Z
LLFSDVVLADAHLGAPHLDLQFFGGSRQGLPTLAMLTSGIGIELTLTFILTFVIYGTCIDTRGPLTGGLMPGLTQAAAVMMAFPLTGAALNPVRWLGPVVWESSLNGLAWSDHSVYWIGPLFGALLAGLVYERIVGLSGNDDPDVTLVPSAPAGKAIKAGH